MVSSYKPWTRQTPDTTNPGHDNMKGIVSRDGVLTEAILV
jgi:hypothetical protein